ncbi:RDD family protein [Catellatospora bangladeshensis]|uniref:RDD domain-containing protein n=1 Tax=Catellatospora bangladeshensis TaxID=310355 RepID=A0A8J3JER8_9ACTN|nr:RDD family protein [Catellatospora bangladeshensis]GIF83151.1 hypothetical protein Cba03nite_45000 [Catellatospora bangladeshensis]
MPYAGWLARAGAFVVDFAILGAVMALVRISGVASEGGPAANVAVLLVFVVHGFNRWYLGGKTGQSLGRRALGIKLVYERGQFPVGALSAFLRDLAHFADTVVFYVGWFFPLWDAKKQTFADKITGTVVLKG